MRGVTCAGKLGGLLETEECYLVPCDGADMATGHLPAHSQGCAVECLQLDVQRGAEAICVWRKAWLVNMISKLGRMRWR